VRAYGTASEEAVHAREFVKDWSGERFVTEEQCRVIEPETASDLKRTNIFLRLVLALFTAIIVGATVGLFFVMFEPRGDAGIGTFLLVFAAGSYAAAEFSVATYRLYRHGIEEALLICSVGMLCGGLAVLSENAFAPAVGIAASVWIWHRFGLAYAPLGAMACVPWLASEWTSSWPARHVIVAAFFAVGLAIVMVIRRRHRFTFQDEEYSTAEGLLWLGIYAAVNLQVSSVDVLGVSFTGDGRGTDFSRTFYWSTYVLTWCLPPVVLTVGLRKKDRFVISVGIVTAILTLITNKLYLGWPRHTWDPMLLGVLLIGVALFVRRWLAAGQDEVRSGFTARRLSGKDKRWMNVGAVAVGLAAPNVIPSASQDHGREFGGGASGGGGASSDF
jgi:hypothetical protein